MESTEPGRVIVLNGAPRAGKSSIVRAIQDSFEGVWMNLGVDAWVQQVTPPALRPGIGLRPGNERHELEPLIPRMFAALYESIAVHSRLGLNVVADLGHHDEATLRDCAGRVAALPAWFIGVRCPLDVIMERRNAGEPGREGRYAVGAPGDPVPAPVRRWQTAVHQPGVYDLEVDTSTLSPAQCAAAIQAHLGEDRAPSAFRALASRA